MDVSLFISLTGDVGMQPTWPLHPTYMLKDRLSEGLGQSGG